MQRGVCGRRERISILDAEIAAMDVTEPGKTPNDRHDLGVKGNDHINVDDGLSSEARYGCAADVLDRDGDVGDFVPDAITDLTECRRPRTVVLHDLDHARQTNLGT
jgi:hypothetical protein